MTSRWTQSSLVPVRQSLLLFFSMLLLCYYLVLRQLYSQSPDWVGFFPFPSKTDPVPNVKERVVPISTCIDL